MKTTKLLMLAILGLILSTTTADAMLDYQTGRWLSQDPLGYVDGVNMYEYVGSKPMIHTDSTGFWGEGIHRDLTRDLAALAGANADCVKAMAEGAEWADINDSTTPVKNGVGNLFIYHPEKGINFLFDPLDIFPDLDFAKSQAETIKNWHFPMDEGKHYVTPDSNASKSEINEGKASCDLTRFARGLHPFQDSWSHQGKPYFSDGQFGHGRGVELVTHKFISIRNPSGKPQWRHKKVKLKKPLYIGLTGLDAALSSSTDDPALFPEDARQVGKRTFEEILDFMKECPNACKRKCFEDGEPAPSLEMWRLENLLNRKYPGQNVINFDPMTNTYTPRL
ncbi:MAG: hypothetical protein JEZ07_12460 [Phycisphaerae bacterium]|nr:hypothetical protein [Phycisphaerae bacterium]